MVGFSINIEKLSDYVIIKKYKREKIKKLKMEVRKWKKA